MLDLARGGRLLMRAGGGFTLVELMITIAVIGVLLVLGVPTLRGVLENGRIRAAAESWKYGLTLARAEAVRQNVRIGFFICEPAGRCVNPGVVDKEDGWVVGRIDANGQPATVLQEGSGGEGTSRMTVTADPAGATLVTFDPLGRVVDPNPDPAASVPFTQLDFESANPPSVAGYKPLRIQMLAAGMPRLCDPDLGGSDPRACL